VEGAADTKKDGPRKSVLTGAPTIIRPAVIVLVVSVLVVRELMKALFIETLGA
jgi:hypothetical protein